MSEEYTPAGDRVYRYEDTRREWRPPEYGAEGWSEKIEEHFQQFYGPIEGVQHEIISDTIHVDIHFIKATPSRPYQVLFTTGMSYLPMNVPEGGEDYRFAELLVCLPPDWPISDEAFKNPNHYWPVYWLKRLARLPHEYNTWLGEGHTIPNGDPAEALSDTTALNGIMLLPPFGNGRDFRPLSMDDGSTVHFYSLVPLYEEEMKFKLVEGSEALVEKLENARIDERIDPKRKNVCKSSWFAKWRK